MHNVRPRENLIPIFVVLPDHTKRKSFDLQTKSISKLTLKKVGLKMNFAVGI